MDFGVITFKKVGELILGPGIFINRLSFIVCFNVINLTISGIKILYLYKGIFVYNELNILFAEAVEVGCLIFDVVIFVRLTFF